MSGHAILQHPQPPYKGIKKAFFPNSIEICYPLLLQSWYQMLYSFINPEGRWQTIEDTYFLKKVVNKQTCTLKDFKVVNK